MKFTTILLALGVTGVLADPVAEPDAALEARTILLPSLCSSWECTVCTKWKPSCSIGWKPKYCSKGWGDKGCVDWCKYSLQLFLNLTVQ